MRSGEVGGFRSDFSAVVFLTRRRNAASADTEGGALRDGDASGKDKGGVEDESLDDDELAYLEDIRDELSD